MSRGTGKSVSTIGELLRRLELSGMRALDCDGCGREFMTRGEGYYCPPCRGDAAPDQLTAFALSLWRFHLALVLLKRAAATQPTHAPAPGSSGSTPDRRP